MSDLAAVFGIVGMVVKAIGLIAAGLLGLVLFVLLLLLLVPVRYKLRIACVPEEASSHAGAGGWQVKGWVSWLLHIVHIPVWQGPCGVEYKVRILGIPWKPSQKKKAEKRRKEPAQIQRQREEHKAVEAAPPEQEKEPEGDFKQKILLFCQRLGRIYDKLQSLIQGSRRLWTALAEGGQKAGRVKEFLQSETVCNAWGSAKECFGYLWRHSHPRRVRGDILLGTGDPCSTGELLGGLGIAYAFLGGGVRITPDFERQILCGYLELQGRLRLVHVVRMLWKLWSADAWKRFRKELDQLKEEL